MKHPKLFESDAKGPGEDKRKGLKGEDKLPNDPQHRRTIMLMALDDAPFKKVYEAVGVLYDPNKHTGRAVDEFVKQHFTGRKRSGKPSKMADIKPTWQWETFRTGKDIGHNEKTGIEIAIKKKMTVGQVAHLTFRTIADTKRVMDQVSGLARIKANVLLKGVMTDEN